MKAVGVGGRESRRATCDLRSEGATRNVLVVEADNNVVVSGSRGQVGNRAGTVFVVLAGDFGLGRALHGQGQASCVGGGEAG